MSAAFHLLSQIYFFQVNLFSQKNHFPKIVQDFLKESAKEGAALMLWLSRQNLTRAKRDLCK